MKNRNEQLNLTICDATGKMIMRETIVGATAGVYNIQFNNTLTSGFYVVTLQTNDRRVEKKLIVN